MGSIAAGATVARSTRASGRRLTPEFARSTALPHIEARRSCRENSCYRPHTHDAFSIGFIDSGAAELAGALDGPVGLEPGDAIVIPADQVHACNPRAGTWLYRMIHADQEWLSSLLPERSADPLFDGIRVLREPRLRSAVGAATDAVFADASAAGLGSTFRALALELLSAAPARTVTGRVDSVRLERLRPALERLRDDAENPRIPELAALLGMDRYRFIREMKRATGLSPLAWRQNSRVNRARRMLREGSSVAEAAYALGFSDQSHFHRVFRAHVAISPGAYRDEAQERARRETPGPITLDRADRGGSPPQ